ncbi:kinase [Alphaproteobacteria bacterium]|nr:kinase [Alphaproteobacteria bacterium]
MIITRTPFRISFFGGGTDYPQWFQKHEGSVLSTTIDKYCYITCRNLPPFFEHKHRIVYSKIESVKTVQEITHPSVRACLNYFGSDQGYEIHHDGDLPARSGLGSSSSFTVGLLNALYGINGKMSSKELLAKDAIHVEQVLLGENVGCQDQIAAAFGGLNKIQFKKNGNFIVNPVILSNARRDELNDHLMLFFTGFSRIASTVADAQIKNIENRIRELSLMHSMVDQAISILQNPTESILSFGQLLHESWMLKRTLSEKISTTEIDEIYQSAINAGAVGGKLLGAGGGGFFILFATPEKQLAIRQALKKLVYVPFRFDDFGSRVVLYQPNGL